MRQFAVGTLIDTGGTQSAKQAEIDVRLLTHTVCAERESGLKNIFLSLSCVRCLLGIGYSEGVAAPRGAAGLSVEAQCQLLCCLGQCETRAPVYHRKKNTHLPFENFRRRRVRVLCFGGGWRRARWSATMGPTTNPTWPTRTSGWPTTCTEGC